MSQNAYGLRLSAVLGGTRRYNEGSEASRDADCMKEVPLEMAACASASERRGKKRGY